VSEPVVAPGGIVDVRGIKAAGGHAGIKKKRRDIAIVHSTEPSTTAAAVFTRNAVVAAPLVVSRRHVADGRARTIVCNSGCANAVTGEQGERDAETTCAAVAKELGVAADEVIVASTGVIGRFLPMDLLVPGLRKLAHELDKAAPGEAAEAIMTTDLVPKEVLVEVEIGGATVRVGGIAKGSGMIHPNMATMLGFLATDAKVSPAALDQALRAAVDETFNMISVDGDTSTNDMVAILATGASGLAEIGPSGPAYDAFVDALTLACQSLAVKIARDGEGATTLIECRVQNARTLEDARKAAKSVIGSSLVKSAVFGRDPNWGRVLAALGYSGAAFDPSRVELWMGNPSGRARVVHEGAASDTVDAEELRRLITKDHVIFILDLHDGAHHATAWGCDLSYDYVKINASYTT